jgi:simple sugar transport system ATP-binding protein
VDVGAQEQIHALLVEARDAGRAVLLQSSELSELRALADRVLVMFGGRVVAELPVVEATDERLGAAMTGAAGSAQPDEASGGAVRGLVASARPQTPDDVEAGG